MKISLSELKTIIKNIIQEDVFDVDKEGLLKNLPRETDADQTDSTGNEIQGKNIYHSFENTLSPEQHGDMVLIKINDADYYDVEKPFEVINKNEIKNEKILDVINQFQNKKIIIANHKFYEDAQEVLGQDSFSGNYLLHDLAHTIYSKIESKIDESISILQTNIRKFLSKSLELVDQNDSHSKRQIFNHYGIKTFELDEYIKEFLSNEIDLNLSSNYTSSDNPFGTQDRFPNIIKHAKEEELKLELLSIESLEDYINNTKTKKQDDINNTKTKNNKIDGFKNDKDIVKSFNIMKDYIKSYFSEIRKNLADKNVINLIGVNSTKLRQV